MPCAEIWAIELNDEIYERAKLEQQKPGQGKMMEIILPLESEEMAAALAFYEQHEGHEQTAHLVDPRKLG